MPEYAHLTLEQPAAGVTQLTLRRPERLNALSWALVEELHAALAEVAGDRSTRVVILTGQGRGFCSGLDLRDEHSSAATDHPVTELFRRQERVAGLALGLQRLPQPVIAAVNGPASGGGLALALASDVRLGGESAMFNVSFVRIGLSGADVGVSHLLPRVVGLGHAAELMLTGRLVGAAEAERIGLVNRVVPDDQLLDAALALAAEITTNAPFGVRMTKQVLHRNVDAPSLEAAIELENRTQILATQTEDMREALAAFLMRREPEFEDR